MWHRGGPDHDDVASSWFRRPQQLSVAIKKAERAVVTPAPAASAPRRAKSSGENGLSFQWLEGTESSA
jgi:hypothetical protein